jgi:hypothetical protein
MLQFRFLSQADEGPYWLTVEERERLKFGLSDNRGNNTKAKQG